MQATTPSHRWRFKTSEQRFILIFGDLFAGGLALMLALYFWAAGDDWMKLSVEFLRTRPQEWFYFLPFVWIVFLVETYDLSKASSMRDTLRSIGLATLISTFLYLIVYFAFPPYSLPRLGVALFIIFVAIFTLIWRMICIQLFNRASKQRRALIIGAGKAGTALVEAVAEKNPKPFNLIGLIDDDPAKIGTTLHNYPVLGNHVMLSRLIQDQNITDLIIAISDKMNHGMFQTLLLAQESGMNLSTMTDTYELLTNRVPIGLLESDWVVRSFLDKTPSSAFYRFFKRLMDLSGSGFGLIFLILLYPLIALIIMIDSGRPVIYKQERLGLGGKPYTIFKFRTMKNNADMDREGLVTAANDQRVTRVGRFLRKSHIDELPQLFNVLKGEMSLVGPRSERSELVTVFQNTVPFYRARMLVKPGMTGWAQIHQPYAETVEEIAVKLEYDLYYIEHANFVMDLVILLRTFSAVFGFKGR